MADPTRLELATSAVTGQRSNQLSYESTTSYYYSASWWENQGLFGISGGIANGAAGFSELTGGAGGGGRISSFGSGA